MKKILILLLFPFIASAQTFETCLVTGRLYLQDGSTKDSIKVMVVKTVARGTSRPIVIQTKRTFYTDSNGYISMPLLRNSDVTFESNAYGLTGKTLTIPNTATATLESLVPTATVPPLYAIAVPNLTVVDSSGGSYSTDSVRFAGGLKAIAPTDGGGTPTIISTATGSGATYGDSIKVAHDIANGKGDADSLKAAYDSLAAHLARISATEQVADGAIQESDSASLHAQKFANRPTRTEVTDTLNANVVRAEVDPTATAKAQAVVADSLKPFPTGLKAAGPLSYVWGVLPGGAQGWKPDSTGGDTLVTARKFVLAPTLAADDDTTLFKLMLKGDKTDFLVFRSSYASLYGVGLRLGGPTTATDRTIRNFFGEIRSSGNFLAPVVTASNTIAINGTAAATIGLAAVGTVKGMKFYGGDSDTLYTFWYNGAPIFKIRGAATDDDACVIGSATMQAGLKGHGRIYVADDSITFLGEAGDVVDWSRGNVFRGTLSQNDTISFTNTVDGQSVTMFITQGNNYTLTFTGVAWPGGVAPILTAVANKRDRFTFIRSGGIIHGDYVQNY